jgi:hypothetical protein
MLKITAEIASFWKYRIEGGKHVIFEFGPDRSMIGCGIQLQNSGENYHVQTLLQGKLLRMTKQPSSIHACNDWMQSRYLEELVNIYSIENGHSSPNYLCPSPGHFVPVYVDPDALLVLHREWIQNRCSSLSETTSENLQVHDAFLIQDFSRIVCPSCAGTLCVEIKPKCGLLHMHMKQNRSGNVDLLRNRVTSVAEKLDDAISSSVLDEFLDLYRNTSHFAFKQQYCKRHQYGEVESEYDPQDLFSNDIDRISVAIVRLVEHPQNNFRVFWNGSLVYGDETKEPGLRSQLIANDPIVSLVQEAVNSGALRSLIAKTLWENRNLLQKLLHLQNSSPCTLEEVQECYTSVESLSVDDVQKPVDPKVYSTLRCVWQFLISRTAMDCSILMSFGVDKGVKTHQSLCNALCQTQCTLVDIFPMKPISKVPAFLINEKRLIRQALLEYLSANIRDP